MTSPDNRKPIEMEPRTEGFGNTADLTRFAGWSAFVSAAAAVLGLVAFGVFMMAGDPFGTLADVTGLALGLSILPVAWGLHSLYRARLGRGSQVIVAIGLLGGITVALASLGLVLDARPFGISAFRLETVATIGSGVVGAWLLGVGMLESRCGVLGRRLGITGVVAGVGYVVLALGFLVYSFEHSVTALGGFVGVAAYTAWAFWLGRRFLSGGTVTSDGAT